MTSETADGWRRPGPTPEQQRVDLYAGLAATVLALLSLTLAHSTGTFLFGPPRPVSSSSSGLSPYRCR